MAAASEIVASLPPEQLVRALEVNDYMLGEARQATDADIVISGMSERIFAAGVPLDRSSSIVRLLHAESVASARYWERGIGARHQTFPFRLGDSGEQYNRSPAAVVHQTREWLTLWLPDTPDDAYNIVPELKADGYTHYLMMPVFTAEGMSNTFSFATKAPEGFSDSDFAFFRAIFPAIAACQEILATRRILHELVRMYVGNEPHKRILSGDVHRGQVTRIRSAILFADMREFTRLTADLSAEAATRLLNDYYDCIVPPVEERGGEVLKFIADGILAIFRAEGEGGGACRHATEAARAGLANVASYAGQPKFEVGIGLHFGEVAFGNVGSGARLDYTVIGRDVNLASRVATLCGTLKMPLLASSQFRAAIGDQPCRPVGAFELKGLKRPEEIIAL
ncbi:adenylate/guanylate cyclase domain-containing protein [Pseudooceanicola sp.]|uniref:adenylate/guanylate cyclase domain-containing protein n=1 Tax=Pseudooceanicola sp. TaxID=1914328 RepID=UPI00351156CB